MHKLKYCPLQSGYTAQIGDGVISQELDGGAPRFRKALKGTYHTANVSWVVSEQGYQYLMAFYRVWARHPSQRFLARLCIDNAPVEDYECYFSSSPMLSGKEAKIFTVTAVLRVKPLKADNSVDDLFVAIGDGEVDSLNLFNPLEELVNEDLPDALGDL